jgi:DNA topoisomerase IB
MGGDSEAGPAAVAGLTRSDPGGPGITRERTPDGFQYRDTSGAVVTDPGTLRRIGALVLPPAWRDVWISPDPLGHIQATGVDTRGRTQYRYHDRWREYRDEQKFDHMLRFALALPGLREATVADLGRRRLSRDRVAAAAVRLIDLGLFRIGGERYAELDHHYGVTTLEKQHVTVGRDGVRFDYIAKEGKRREITVTDEAVRPTIRALTRAGHDLDHLFAWEQEGVWRPLRSNDVSRYIADRAGAHFTAKEFRTWNATVLMALLLASAEPAPPGRGRQRVITTSVKGVAVWLGDTPTVARSSYIDPRLVTRYEADGVLPAVPAGPAQLPAAAEAEAAVHALLSPASGAAELPGGPDAAVDRDDRAGDVGATPPAQVDRHPGHVLGTSDPAQR